MATVRSISGKDPNYEFIELLGRGGFGKVTKERRIKDDKIMACKSIDISGEPDLIKYISREVATWSSLSDQERYIAKYSGDCAFSKQMPMTVKLYMDFYAGGDLQRAIDTVYSRDEIVHPVSALTWAVQVAKGVRVCHDRGIIHRDLKPPNVLLSTTFPWNSQLWAVTRRAGLPTMATPG